MEKISELVWLYIKRRPFLKEIIREKMVNHSALARKISLEAFGTKKHENAIKMALVRMGSKLREKGEDLEGRILTVLKGSSITIRNKVAVVIASRELEGAKYLSYVESKSGITYILENSEFSKVQRSRSVVRTEPNLNLITIHSPPALEDTPGVIAHILDALAVEGINVVEFVSCYTDTMLIIRQADTARAFQMLSELMD